MRTSPKMSLENLMGKSKQSIWAISTKKQLKPMGNNKKY